MAGEEKVATYTGLTDGSYTFRVRVTDRAGNMATGEVTVDVAVPRGAIYLPLVKR